MVTRAYRVEAEASADGHACAPPPSGATAVALPAGAPTARVLVSSLRIAKDLRTRLTDTWTQAQSDTILLFITCMAAVIMFLFFVEEEQELSAGLVIFCVHQPVEPKSCSLI
jgi:hypothetical protein